MSVDKLKEELEAATRVLRELEGEAENSNRARDEAEAVLKGASVDSVDAAYEVFRELDSQAEKTSYKRMAAEREVRELESGLQEAEKQARLQAFEEARVPLERAVERFNQELALVYERLNLALHEHGPKMAEAGRAAGFEVSERIQYRVAATTASEASGLKQFRIFPTIKIISEEASPGHRPAYTLRFCWIDRDGKFLPEQVPQEYAMQVAGGMFEGLRPYVESTLTDNPLEVSEPPRKEFKP